MFSRFIAVVCAIVCVIADKIGLSKTLRSLPAPLLTPARSRLSPSFASLLVFHGSPDPRPQAAATALAELFRQRIQYIHLPSGSRKTDGFWAIDHDPDHAVIALAADRPPESIVGTASLECSPLPLHQQIEQFSHKLQQTVAEDDRPPTLLVLPLFLLAGVHVMEDIPAEVALAQQRLGQAVNIEICPYLGAHPRLRRILTERMSPIPAEAWILMAHGSRRVNANQAIADLADHLGAVPAYWSVAPKLETMLAELQPLQVRTIGILPYFCFQVELRTRSPKPFKILLSNSRL